MTRKQSAGKPTWADPDDAPELTEAWFKSADIYEGETLIRRGRGRPRSQNPKRQVTIRLDPEVIEGIRGTGPGWQTRVNEALRRWLQRQRKAS